MQQAFAVWMMALFASMLVYKLITHLSGRPAIGLKLVNLIAAVIAIALMFNLRQSGVLNFMLQILLLAAICRLLALKHSYDARQLVWVHYFLIGSCFVMHQDMLVALII
ncbi:transglutaminaseTgpA domain-containing protein, partial [Rheinheimera baltica]|uniref:transglutaminaseTgpA domain-containing protein n=1 Tax=Rheinheimera baltica TaxID=67576 RepID=UPI00273DDDC7